MRGDLHIGGVMIQLVDSLGNTPNVREPLVQQWKAVKRMQQPVKGEKSSEVKSSASKCICPAVG